GCTRYWLTARRRGPDAASLTLWTLLTTLRSDSFKASRRSPASAHDRTDLLGAGGQLSGEDRIRVCDLGPAFVLENGELVEGGGRVGGVEGGHRGVQGGEQCLLIPGSGFRVFHQLRKLADGRTECDHLETDLGRAAVVAIGGDKPHRVRA